MERREPKGVHQYLLNKQIKNEQVWAPPQCYMNERQWGGEGITEISTQFMGADWLLFSKLYKCILITSFPPFAFNIY